jgi:hypothetical protein
MTVEARLSVTCDECGVRVSLPVPALRDGTITADYKSKVPIRWWVQRWGWRVTDDDRDLCPDHDPAPQRRMCGRFLSKA